MTCEELTRQLNERALAEWQAGASIDIDDGLGTIAINLSDGSEYFFSDCEAVRLMEEVPDWIDAESYLLAVAQNW